MKKFNLGGLYEEAQKSESGEREEFIVPEHNKFYDSATVVHSQWRMEDDGMPSFWIILKTEDGSFPLTIKFGKHDFANKRSFANLRALGITDFENLDPDVAVEVMKGSEVGVKVVWGKNKGGGDPWANHTLHPVERNIPEPTEEEDDFDDDDF